MIDKIAFLKSYFSESHDNFVRVGIRICMIMPTPFKCKVTLE